MSILVSRFFNPTRESQEWNAVAKVINERPEVVFIGNAGKYDYYQVNSTRDLDVSYPVRVWSDDDHDFFQHFDLQERKGQLVMVPQGHSRTVEGQFWVECFCPAASPPFDPSLRNLICWLPKVCYHQAAVVLFVSNES